MQYPIDILEITYVDLICNTLIWVFTNISIVASHKTKIKKSSPISIPSSYIYKLFQSSNHEIRDFFTTSVLHKSMPFDCNETCMNIWNIIVIPSCTSNTSNQFFVQCNMHIYYIWILVTLFLYK
jgi:hypothetical protein